MKHPPDDKFSPDEAAITAASAELSGLARRADVRTQVVDDEMIILDRREGLIHQLNKTAGYIWDQCDGQRTPAEIAGALCERFEVEEPTALEDVIAVLQQLRESKLVEHV